MTPDKTDDLACLYALDLLDENEKRFVEDAAKQTESMRAELAVWEEVAARVGLAAPEVEPRPELRARLLNEVHRDKMASRPLLREEISGICVLRHGLGDWRATPYAGVSTKLLYLDKISGLATSMLKLEPGAIYPAHHHTAEEQCYVIEGDIRLGEHVHLHQGDFTTARPGTNHGYLTSDGGCTVIIVASVHDEILG